MRQTFVRSFAFLALLAGLAATPSFAQDTCVVSRDQIIAEKQAGATDEELTATYAGCTAADVAASNPTPTAAAQAPTSPSSIIISNPGNSSTFWEAITSCGYHPQRKELACPVEIRQRFGFGGFPALQPVGSYERVLFCVDYNDGFGLVPVNTNGFHIHDEPFGVNPRWYFAAIVPANERLFQQPLTAQTLRARAILSWTISPGNNCNFIPIWGNRADFRIRLDP